MSRGEMSLAEVQCHLDKEGASNLVIDLIMNASSDRVFHESILLAIALLEGGNTTIQVGRQLGYWYGIPAEQEESLFWEPDVWVVPRLVWETAHSEGTKFCFEKWILLVSCCDHLVINQTWFQNMSYIWKLIKRWEYAKETGLRSST